MRYGYYKNHFMLHLLVTWPAIRCKFDTCFRFQTDCIHKTLPFLTYNIKTFVLQNCSDQFFYTMHFVMRYGYYKNHFMLHLLVTWPAIRCKFDTCFRFQTDCIYKTLPFLTYNIKTFVLQNCSDQFFDTMHFVMRYGYYKNHFMLHLLVTWPVIRCKFDTCFRFQTDCIYKTLSFLTHKTKTFVFQNCSNQSFYTMHFVMRYVCLKNHFMLHLLVTWPVIRCKFDTCFRFQTDCIYKTLPFLTYNIKTLVFQNCSDQFFDTILFV